MSREYVAIWGEARVPIGDNCGATRTPSQEESSQHHAEVISYEMHKRNRHHNKPATRAERRTRREIELEATRAQKIQKKINESAEDRYLKGIATGAAMTWGSWTFGPAVFAFGQTLIGTNIISNTFTTNVIFGIAGAAVTTGSFVKWNKYCDEQNAAGNRLTPGLFKFTRAVIADSFRRALCIEKKDRQKVQPQQLRLVGKINSPENLKTASSEIAKVFAEIEARTKSPEKKQQLRNPGTNIDEGNLLGRIEPPTREFRPLTPAETTDQRGANPSPKI